MHVCGKLDAVSPGMITCENGCTSRNATCAARSTSEGQFLGYVGRGDRVWWTGWRGAGGGAGTARHLVRPGRAAPDAATHPQRAEPHQTYAGALLDRKST